MGGSRALPIAFAFAVLSPASPGQVLLNELLARNSTILADEDGDFSDWIELANAGSQPVDLGGLYLTDDPADLQRWRLPSLSLGSGEFLVVFASGKDRRDPGGELHTNFKLAGEGEYLALVDADGSTVLFKYSPKYLPQTDDVSFGLIDGDTAPPGYYFPVPTPGAPNDHPKQLAPPEFVTPRGFHDDPFSLELTAGPGEMIYYSLDSSVPDEVVGTEYVAPIAIDTTAVVRAMAFAHGALSSGVTTHSYFFLEDVIDSAVMSPNITDDPVYGPLMRPALEAHATISVVTEDAISQEREIHASAELLTVSGSEPGFQVNCGAKYVGGHSLSYPKKSVRLYFRDEYGPSKLRYSLFEPHLYSPGAAGTFDQLQLRSGGHDTVFYLGIGAQYGDAQYLRNRWMSDAQLRMGHESLHGRFVHLYLNGVYWGHYHLMERPQESHVAWYMDGEKEDFAFTNAGRTGDRDVWNQVLGSAPDWSLAQQWIDVPNLIDYMLVNYYGGNDWDWNTNQNWMAAGPREAGRGGWKFFCWDSDIIFQRRDTDVTNPYKRNRTGNYNNAPGGLFTALRVHPDFLIQVADQVYRHYFQGGVLTRQVVRETYDRRAQEVELSLIAETARWTDGEWTRDVDWEPERVRLHETFFAGRTRVVINQLRAEGLYPSIDPPRIKLIGFEQSPAPGSGSQRVALLDQNAGGALYYTTDGTDPRAPGGGVAGQLYATPFAWTASMIVRARALLAGEWSALRERALVQPQDRSALTITEIHYHPLGEGVYGAPDFVDGDEFEFLELFNRGVTALDLTGVELCSGIDYRFPVGASLAAGARLVVASDAERFSLRYGQLPFGVYEGRLSNDGDRPVLVDTQGLILDIVEYSDDDPWPPDADGSGFSLELIDPSLDNRLPSSWKSSSQLHGSPGQ